MTLQYSPLILALLLSAATSGGLGLYAWQHRWRQRGVLWFALLMFAACLWSMVTALRWASVPVSVQYLWLRVGYVAVVSIPVFWLLFAADYTRRGRSLTRGQVALLWIVPAITLILALSNPWHHWMWSAVVAGQPDESGVTLATYSDGPWFFVHLTYAYVLLLVGAILIVAALIRSPERYRGQAGGLIVGLLAPWAANALFQLSVIVWDPTPFAFSFSGAAFAWSIFRHRLLNIVSVAHDAVIRGLRDPVIVLDVRRRVIDVNPSAARLLGRTTEEVIGESGEALLSAWPDVVEQLKRTDDGETEVDLSSNGASHPYTLRLSTLLDRGGYPSGRLLHFQDIEKHKRTEAALHETEESFYAVVEGMKADAYFEVDRTGIIRYVNRAFHEALGHSREEVIGAHFANFIAAESMELLREYFRAAYRGEVSQQPLECFFRKGDGSLAVGEVSISLVRVKDGNPSGARGIVRDVTERKRAEEALQKAKKAAEEASEAKSRFLTNVSHELRTPLTSVLGFVKVIQKRMAEHIVPHVDAEDPKTARAVRQVQENLDIVAAEGERLTTLINDVIAVSDLESGRGEWQRQPVTPAEIVERAVASIAVSAEQKGLQLRADVEPGLPTLVGDREHLTQALVNLISNAVKFTDPGGSIVCAAQLGNGEITLSVTDNGIGIAPEDRAKVFEPFVQIGDTLTGKPTGTGLGLPICKQIIERHGGRIWVESELGRGSTFTLSLPVPAIGE
jgi:PAS domain S-box-containing protein